LVVQDVEEKPDGGCQIKQGTEKDRVVSVTDQQCPVIASADRCKMLNIHGIGAVWRCDDIFSAPSFSDRTVAPKPVHQNAACCLVAPSSLS